MCISVSAHLLQLQNLSLETLELLLILLRVSEDLITRSARLLQLPLVVLHLGLDENKEMLPSVLLTFFHVSVLSMT